MAKRKRSSQTITDPLLDPFFISKDEYCYTVKQIVESDSTHFKAKGKGKTYEKNLYYYPQFGQAINKIAKLKAETEDYNSLKEFIETYELISNQIKKYTDGIRSTI